MVRRVSKVVLLAAAVVPLVTGCEPDLDTTRRASPRGTFGAVVYQEACQRLAYTAQIEEQAAGRRAAVDVTGQLDPACSGDLPMPDDAPAKLRALAGQRAPLVQAVDLALPPALLPPLQALLEAIAVLDDDGTMPAAILALAGSLARLADDADLAAALSRTVGRAGFVPVALADGLAERVVRAPVSDALLGDLLDLLCDGAGRPGPELAALLAALAHELEQRSAPVGPAADDPSRGARLALDLLLRPSPPSMEAAAASPSPLSIAARDGRGAPRLAGPPAPPFVDRDGDGRADLDAHGRFVDALGRPLPIGAPFPVPGVADPPGSQRDPQGRLLLGSSTPFAYLPVEGTVLAALLREVAALADPAHDDLFGLLRGGAALLGRRVDRVRLYRDAQGRVVDSIAYRGFDLPGAALADLAHAAVQLLGAPRIDELLRTLSTLLVEDEDPSARVIAALLDVSDRAARPALAAAALPATSTLYDRLAPLFARALRVPGLVDDLMAALADPHTAALAPMMARLFDHADRFTLDQDSRRAVGAFASPVDRSQPDSDGDAAHLNRSLMQRMMHLIHDANGVELCNRQGAQIKLGVLPLTTYDRCGLFRIEDLGLFFALSIADHAVTSSTAPALADVRRQASFREHLTSPLVHQVIVDDGGLLGDRLIQSLTGIEGFTRFPTPEALARALFLDQAHQSAFLHDTLDPARCSDGDRFIDAHNDTLLAWEQPLPINPGGFARDTFYDALRPVITAFARHQECVGPGGPGDCSRRQSAVKIFLDLVSTLHEHWASPQSQVQGRPFQSQRPEGPRFATGDGAVRYEPLLVEVLAASDLVPALRGLAPVLRSLTVDGQGGGAPALPVLVDAARYLFDPLLSPPTLTYRDGRTSSRFADGVTPVPRATPYYLLADALSAKRRQLAMAPAEVAAAWAAASSRLVDEALAVEGADGPHRLRNRRLHGVAVALLGFLRRRLAAHARAGDDDAWVHHQLSADLVDLLDGPLLAAGADALTRLASRPAAVQRLYRLLGSLLDEQRGGLAVALTSVADLLQLLLDDRTVVPVGHAAGRVLEPSQIGPALALLLRARALDPARPPADDAAGASTLVTVLRNLMQRPASGRTPLSALGDALSEVNRVQPGAGTDLEAADYRHQFAEARDFLADEQRGFLRFAAIVKNRRLPDGP